MTESAPGIPDAGAWLPVAAVGVLLLLAVAGARWLLRSVRGGGRGRRLLQRGLPVLLSGVGLAYAVWGAYRALAFDPMLARAAVLLVLVAAVVAAFPAFADVVAGLFVRGSRICEVGDRVRIEGVSGKVVAIAVRAVHLETEEGERIVVPHARVLRVPMVRAPKDEVVSHAVRIPVPPNVAADAMARALVRAAEEHHAVSVARRPTAQVGEGAVTVTVFLVLPAARADVERQLWSVARDLGVSTEAGGAGA